MKITIIAFLGVMLTSTFIMHFTPITPEVEPTIIAVETETIPPAPTLPYIDLSIQYISTQDKSIIRHEINRCKKYLELTTVSSELFRVQDILEQYEWDLHKVSFIDVPSKYNKKDFKSYEDYRLITWTGGPHYKLQHQYAYTNSDGIRMADGRYCIALGSYFVTRIGQYVDIVLENGTIIPCILGDQKSDNHTDALHIAHPDGSIVEFIIDKNVISSKVYNKEHTGSGNVSDCYAEWRSPVVQVIVYDINIFDK